MNTPPKSIKRPRQATFDVTCVVGTVTYDPDGSMNEREAAFSIIANAGSGEYTFPNVNGGTVRVRVEHDD